VRLYRYFSAFIHYVWDFTEAEISISIDRPWHGTLTKHLDGIVEFNFVVVVATLR
jgi:hypothetical protein